MKPHPSSEFLDAVSALMVATRDFLQQLEIIPRQSADADSILLALISKSIVLTEAIVLMVKNGFSDEAFGLCRTCVEIGLTIRYLTNKDTVQRSNRYFNYFAKDKSEWSRLTRKYYPDQYNSRLTNTEEIERLAAAYKSPHKWHECPNGLKDLASEVDMHEKRDDGSPLDQLFDYEVIYKSMSHYVHGTIPSIDPAHLTLPGDRFVVRPQSGYSMHGSDALRTSLLNVHLNIYRVMRYFNMNVSDQLETQFVEVENN